MSTNENEKIIETILEAHRKGVEAAIDLSIRTGTPLVIEKDGKIQELKPKYVLVPIEEEKPKRRPKK